MNRILILLCAIAIVAFIIFNIKVAPKKAPVEDTKKEDSLMRVIDHLSEVNRRNDNLIRQWSDSIYLLNLDLQEKQSNYLTLKKQNEKLLKERSAIIRSYTDDELLRYLSRRYSK